MSRRLIKKVAIGTLASLGLLILFLMILPTLIGTKWIYQPLVDRLAADDFVVKLDSVRLRWFTPLQFRGIEVEQRDGTALLSIAEINTDRGLLGYLLSGRQMGRIEIVRPLVDVRLIEDTTNLERFVKAIEGKRPDASGDTPSAKLKVDVEVAVLQASAKLQRDGEEPLVVIPPFDANVRYLGASDSTRLKVAPTQVLKQVELTQELIKLGLGHAVPLLAESAWFDGSVSLDIGEIDVPLDTPLASSGEAVLTMHTVRSGPTQPAVVSVLDFVAKLRGKETPRELVFVDGTQVKLAMRDAHVTHSGLRAGLPRIDPRLQIESAGAVGLADKALALTLGVPVPIEQFARRDSVKELGVPTIGIPIGGTLDQPVVDWNAMRGESAELLGQIRDKLADESPGAAALLSAFEGLAKGDGDEAIAVASDLIRELRARRRAGMAEPDTKLGTDTEGAQESESQPLRRLRDSLRGMLRK